MTILSTEHYASQAELRMNHITKERGWCLEVSNGHFQASENSGKKWSLWKGQKSNSKVLTFSFRCSAFPKPANCIRQSVKACLRAATLICFVFDVCEGNIWLNPPRLEQVQSVSAGGLATSCSSSAATYRYLLVPWTTNFRRVKIHWMLVLRLIQAWKIGRISVSRIEYLLADYRLRIGCGSHCRLLRAS